MAGATSSTGGGPKILLAKPGLVSRGGRSPSDDYYYDSAAAPRSRLPSAVGSLLSDSAWDFLTDRFLPFLTDNTEFTVVGVIGPQGVGKSTIINLLYGFDPTTSSSPGPLPMQSHEIRAQVRHCTLGIQPRISPERIILLDTQPVFSASVLAEIVRPDGSSSIPVLNGEPLPAELAHELMGIQLGVLLASICHIILVVSEGVHDISMWRLMSTVDLLKHGIPDPSSPSLSHSHASSLGSEKENKDKLQEAGEEYMAAPVFIHTKLADEDTTRRNLMHLKKALRHYFSSSSFMATKSQLAGEDTGTTTPELYLVPRKKKDDSPMAQHESYASALWKLRDQVLSMNYPSFGRPVSERDWLKNSAKIWDLIKNSSVIGEYARMLQSSGLFRR